MATIPAAQLDFAVPQNRRCRALGLADNNPCEADATSSNNHFCRFHSMQCHGLYKGYKWRNAQLDALSASPPAYLADCRTKLANENFSVVEDDKVLEGIHAYLFKTYALLDRVIKARKLHHSHFYAQAMDYGHEKYLNSLITQKLTVQRALERLTQRLAEVLYQKKKWFKWARECQEVEEKQRENEQKKIRREAALFRRQAKKLEARVRELREKEDVRRQEEYLEAAYRESVANQSVEADDEAWDPIEDIMENEHGTYVELIKHFLWLKLKTIESPPLESGLSPEIVVDGTCEPLADINNIAETPMSSTEPSVSQNGKNKKKARSKKKKDKPITDSVTEIEHINAISSSATSHSGPVLAPTQGGKKRQDNEPDMTKVESREETRTRLVEGMKVIDGGLRYRDISGKTRKTDRTEPMPIPEADRLIEEIAEIKTYLFCRLLLGNAVLLPAAMKANSVGEFLKDPEVKTHDLRDLSLRLEQPKLQEIRDACADFCRKENESDTLLEDELNKDEDSEWEDDTWKVKIREKRHKHHLPKIWQSNREKAIRTARPQASVALQEMLDRVRNADEKHGARIDFGAIDENGGFQKCNLRVKICGHYIYNYPFQGAMKRGGWLHFSIMARECCLYDAVELCKSWDEFLELSVLTLHNYFPTPQWLLWAGDSVKRRYLRLNFFPYFICDDTSEVNASLRECYLAGGRIPASHEMRDFICAHMNRNDPASRRFIQYTSMQTSRLLILVRDGKTGRIVVTPPKDELWLIRSKYGYGREARTDWETKRYVGPFFFEQMETYRSFRLGFDDYYDIYIWSRDPEMPRQILHASVIEMLHKAHRIVQYDDIFEPTAPILKTITRDPDAWRTRDIREGETAQSIWDETRNELRSNWRTLDGGSSVEMPRHLVYGEADALEDQILFPEYLASSSGRQRFKPIENSLTRFESGRMKKYVVEQFINGGDCSDGEFDGLSMDYLQKNGPDGTDTSEQNDAAKENTLSLSHDNLEGDELEYLERFDKEATEVTWNDRDGPPRDLPLDLFPQLAVSEKIVDSLGPGPNEEDLDMEEVFSTYIEVYKSKVFKEAWHGCELDPVARESWREYISIRRDAENHPLLFDESYLLSAQILNLLEYHSATHPRMVKDARRACTVVLLFSDKVAPFLKSKLGAKHKDSKLLNQKGRSKEIPDRRSCRSCKHREASFYKVFDDTVQASRTKAKQLHYPELPAEWDICIRPKLAQLFKHGVICVSYTPHEYVPGKAFACEENGHPLDLFIDYRRMLSRISVPKHTNNPYDISIDSLRENARKFASSWPEARFALLRLWSTPYFYPFMIAVDNRPAHAFHDAIGRAWEWKFMPTDMPYSENSVHFNMTERFEPYMAKFEYGNKLKIRKDVILVIGENERELLKLAAAATFIVQTRPWRLEVDFSKSFVNVDVEFLTGLDNAWWV